MGGVLASNQCALCKHAAEDLIHFLFQCPMYSVIKGRFFAKDIAIQAMTQEETIAGVLAVFAQVKNINGPAALCVRMWKTMWCFRLDYMKRTRADFESRWREYL